MKSVLFLFRKDRVKLLNQWEKGESPCDFFYGMQQMKKKELMVDFVDDSQRKNNSKLFLCLPFQKIIGRRVGVGFSLHIIWHNWKKISNADVIISTVDTCGLPLLMLKSMGIISQPVIYISQGLSDRIERLPKNIINNFIINKYTHWLKSADGILVLGEGAAKSTEKVFNLPKGKVDIAPFGIDIDFWTPSNAKGKGDFILSIGSDPGRDYGTLLKAISDYPLHIVTRLQPDNALDFKNVTIKSDYNNLQLRELYRNCRFVVIPLKDISQPSGQSATLQAMACGKTVILTRTKGLWDTAIMQNDKNCILVTPNDKEELQRTISKLWNQPEDAIKIGKFARKTVEENYSSTLFAEKLFQQVKNLI